MDKELLQKAQNICEGAVYHVGSANHTEVEREAISNIRKAFKMISDAMTLQSDSEVRKKLNAILDQPMDGFYQVGEKVYLHHHEKTLWIDQILALTKRLLEPQIDKGTGQKPPIRRSE